MSIKNTIICLIMLSTFALSAYADETIKAQNNAYRHNNKGIVYLQEKYYYGAIKEFQIAIDLNPNSQAAAVYYTNLGKTYEKIGYHNLARPCFEKAVSLNTLCFEYYLNIATNYKNLGILDEQLAEFQTRTDSPLNEIMVGLLFIQKGHKTTGITVLDDFCNKEQNLMITTGVKNYLKELTKELE